MDKSEKFLIVMFFLATFIIIGLMITANSNQVANLPKSTDAQTTQNIPYQLFYIEGMPCVSVGKSVVPGVSQGISCDWSKWKGR